MKEISCKIGQKGFCTGKAVLLREPSAIAFSLSENVEEDKKRLAEIIAGLRAELTKQTASAVRENAKILEADRMILEDEEFSGAIVKVLEEKRSGLAYAVQEGCRELAEQFEHSDSDYIRGRAADVRGLGHRMIDLIEKKAQYRLTEPSVIAAEELTPEGLAQLDQKNILGIVTVKGSAAGHVSIMAGNLGVPYVYGVPSLSDFTDGTYVIIDTGAGKVIADPDEEMRKEAELTAENLRKTREEEKKAAGGEKLRTKIYANISDADHLELLETADGIGLFRSEFLFLENTGEPDEETQYAAYWTVCEAMDGKEVVIRTMDIGADKKVSWMELPEEKNPALGSRGIRLSMQNPELFLRQLRALLRAAVCGNLKIMFPMITSVWEVKALKKMVQQAAEQLEAEGIPYRIPPLGIMIETPAAVLIADLLAKDVDFFSIGTNDLTQYTLALDREAMGLEDFYIPHHEALIRLIRMAVEAGHKAGIPTAVCGELAADPEMIPRLIEAGVDELSVAVAKLEDERNMAFKAESELFLKLANPCDGQVIPMEKIGDPVFASGMMGQAVGVIPADTGVYAPVAGKLVDLVETKHSFTIETKGGQLVLVHVGIDTVKLGGKGFEAMVKKGDELACGQPVLKVDFDTVKENGYDPTVVVILLNQ